MKNLLIISATPNTNLKLSEEIKDFFSSKEDVNPIIINLEEFDLPLYTPSLEDTFTQNKNFPENIKKIKDILLNSHAIIWCSPEYNGGISPIVTNTIAWISRATNDWKEAFKEKNNLICSSSGGNGKNFVAGFRMQLEYLGSEVNENSIIRTKKVDINRDSFNEILSGFYSQLNN